MRRPISALAATLVAALTAAVLIAPTGAVAAKKQPPQVRQALRECQTSVSGTLRRAYSARILRLALREVDGDVAEYTGCFDAFRQALRGANATVVAGIRRGRRGGFVKGVVVLRDAKGRTVDTLQVKKGNRVTFKVRKGRYTLRADGRKRCTVRVTAKARKTVRAAIVCR